MAKVPFATREVQLASGEIIEVGINMYALRLMTKYPGGLSRLRRDMEEMQTMNPEGEDFDEERYDALLERAMDALSHMLWCLVRAGGMECSPDDCARMIGLDDFMEIHQLFDEFSEAAKRMTAGKNFQSLMKSM